jgi:hypothetical protein
MAEEANKAQKAVGIGCVTLLVLVVLLVVIGAIAGSPNQERDEAALDAIDSVYAAPGRCLATANDGNWREAALVLSSQSTDELVIVEVYLTRTLTGEEITYRFGVPLDTNGQPTGGALPGNEAARAC